MARVGCFGIRDELEWGRCSAQEMKERINRGDVFFFSLSDRTLLREEAAIIGGTVRYAAWRFTSWPLRFLHNRGVVR